jgi:hypothetical protein
MGGSVSVSAGLLSAINISSRPAGLTSNRNLASLLSTPELVRDILRKKNAFAGTQNMLRVSCCELHFTFQQIIQLVFLCMGMRRRLQPAACMNFHQRKPTAGVLAGCMKCPSITVLGSNGGVPLPSFFPNCL